jgi:tetratricopeptide (TPR) repeat protein
MPVHDSRVLTDRSISGSYTAHVEWADEWADRANAAIQRYVGGEQRPLDQRQLTQLGNAAWAAGLSLLMAGRTDESADWFRRAAERYRESWADAPPDSWGRPIAAMKALLLAGDDASEAARWALDARAPDAESPIGRYAGTLALLVLGDDVAARVLATTLRDLDDFPQAVADALVELAGADAVDYQIAIEHILESFEERTDFLEDIPVADTVLVLQELAIPRDLVADLEPSALLP